MVNQGNPGDFYLDQTASILYGAKQATAMLPPEYTLTTTPTTDTAGSFRLGNLLKAMVDMQVVGARFWRPSESTMLTRPLFMYNASQALVGTSVASTEALNQSGWVNLPFPTPIAVSAGAEFTICYDCDYYTYDTTVTSADPTHATWVCGIYGPEGAGCPTTQAGGGSFGADAHIQFAGGTVWPVALKGA